MDITGARWGLQSAEAILKLRALTANGDFGKYWTFHLKHEHQRIHHARYRDDLTSPHRRYVRVTQCVPVQRGCAAPDEVRRTRPDKTTRAGGAS